MNDEASRYVSRSAAVMCVVLAAFLDFVATAIILYYLAIIPSAIGALLAGRVAAVRLGARSHTASFGPVDAVCVFAAGIAPALVVYAVVVPLA